MTTLDVDKLLEQVTDESPAGEDLEYDPLFIGMESAAIGKDEQQFGDTLVAAEEPDWRAVRKSALDLLQRSKDLRVAVYLTRALIHTDGLPGLNEGLSLVRQLVERFWDSIHPQLDPDDGFDPVMRVNILVSLCDPLTMLHSIRVAPLVSSRAFGQYSLRDIGVAAGVIAVNEAEDATPDAAAIDAAFMDCDLEALQATSDAVSSAIDNTNLIETFVTEKVGTENAVSLEALVHLLQEVQHVLSDHLSKRGITGSETEAPGEVVVEPGTAPLTGQIQSRADVIQALDKISEYYKKYEPSSPVPLLMQRAKRLVSKDFMEIMQDLAPDGVNQASLMTGFKPDSEESQASEW